MVFRDKYLNVKMSPLGYNFRLNYSSSKYTKEIRNYNSFHIIAFSHYAYTCHYMEIRVIAKPINIVLKSVRLSEE